MLYICSRLSLASKLETAGRWAYHNAIKNNFHKPNNIMNKSELKPACVFEQFAKVNMDMVCEKLVDVDIDFTKDPIETYVDGEWMKAKGTTLGADDGIGCAIEMAILDSNDIEHGPVECVFTRDEETGLTGAMGMEAGFMTGNMLINLDSEDEGQIFISCAGGQNATATFKFDRDDAPEGFFFMNASIKGLVGGHSGDDINKKRANCIKLLTRFLFMGQVVFAVPAADKETVKADGNIFAANVEEEFHVTEPDMKFALESCDAEKVIKKENSEKFILAMQAVYNGVLAMCQDKALEWMVETSNNVASVNTSDNEIVVVTSQRSNVMSNLQNMTNTVKAALKLGGAEVVVNDGYPAWKMNPNSKLTDIVVETYKKLFNKEPLVIGIHAGLECGLFSEKYPHLDMVSFGPTLRGVHSPDERLLIPTVEMVWDHLLEILKNVPKK